jgi:hypothetical protein
VTPFADRQARVIADYVRHHLLPEFPGADEKARLETILSRAPAWLLWFTHSDLFAGLAGINVPDLSGVSRFLARRTLLRRSSHRPVSPPSFTKGYV